MTLTQINKAGLDELALDHVFTIGASGTDHYTFQGEGLNGTVNDPTLYLTRGKTYRFENGSGGHPIRIQSTSGASGTAYNTGVTNNAGSGTVIVEVQHDAPDVLYYQCTSHAAMNGVLYITGALADGGVTTAKLADDAVTDAKLANSINSAIAANTAKSTNATHTGDVTGSGSLTIANNAVTTAKIADDAVTNAKLADGSVQTSTLADTAVSTSKIADGQITNAKIGSGAVHTSNLADTAVSTSKITDDAVNSAKIADAAISNNHVNSSAAIQGSKIIPQFGSQNIESTGYQTLTGELRPYWIGAQTQCTRNTHNNHVYWKVAEVTGGGSEGGKIEFFGTTDYSGLGHNQQAARTTVIIRHLTNNQLAGIWWSESGGYSSIQDVRWKYTGSNNVYEIWVKVAGYANVVPHITGSFDYAKTFGSTTGSGTAPSGSTAFENKFAIEMAGNVNAAINIDNEGLITYPARPCFHGGSSGQFEVNNYVEYDAVHVNKGSHYSTSNDRFVCPCDGVYFISVFGMSFNTQTTMDLACRKNGSDYNGLVPYSRNANGTQYHHLSGSALISCSENDYLQVFIGNGSMYGTTGGRHSGFTVFLVA